jgi:hypothetical protein
MNITGSPSHDRMQQSGTEAGIRQHEGNHQAPSKEFGAQSCE